MERECSMQSDTRLFRVNSFGSFYFFVWIFWMFGEAFLAPCSLKKISCEIWNDNEHMMNDDDADDDDDDDNA